MDDEWIRMDLRGYAWICLDMLGYAWICMDMHGYAWITWTLQLGTWSLEFGACATFATALVANVAVTSYVDSRNHFVNTTLWMVP